MDNMSEQSPAPANSQPSLEQRIGSIFDQTPDNAPKQPVAAEPQTDDTAVETEATSENVSRETESPADSYEEIEFEGERLQIPKGSKLKDALLRQQDYTRKTQEVAEQRRLYEQSVEQARLWQLDREFTQSIQPQQVLLAQFDAALKQYEGVNWAQMSTDEIVRTKLEMDRLKEGRDQVSKDIDGKKAQFQQAISQNTEKLVRQGQEMLSKSIPGWNESVAKEVMQHAISDGYTEAELQTVLDPRNVTTLWKAMQYDKLQQKAKTTVQEAKSVKTTPTNPMDPKTKDYLNYRKQLQKAPPNSDVRKKLVQDRVASIFGG